MHYRFGQNHRWLHSLGHLKVATLPMGSLDCPSSGSVQLHCHWGPRSSFRQKTSKTKVQSRFSVRKSYGLSMLLDHKTQSLAVHPAWQGRCNWQPWPPAVASWPNRTQRRLQPATSVSGELGCYVSWFSTFPWGAFLRE